MTNLEKYNAALQVMKVEADIFIKECYPVGPVEKLEMFVLNIGRGESECGLKDF